MSLRTVSCLALLAAAFLWPASLFWPASLLAEDELSKYRVGDRIIVDYHGKNEEAEVTELDKTFNKVRVRFVNERFGLPGIPWPIQLKDVRGFAPDGRPNRMPEGELTTWTDESGDFKVRARLIRVDGADVELRQEDGALLRIPLDKLSAKDRQTAKDQFAKLEEQSKKQAANPFKTVTPAATAPKPSLGSRDTTTKINDPPKFAASDQPKLSTPGRFSEDEKPTEFPVRTTDWTGLSVVLVTNAAPSGAYRPDAETPLKQASAGINLPPIPDPETKRDIFSAPHARKLFPAREGGAIVAVFESDGFGTRQLPRTWLSYCDPVKATATPPIKLDAVGTQVIDVDPTGKRILARSRGSSHSTWGGRLDVFQRSGDGFQHVVSWVVTPDKSSMLGAPSLTYAGLVDDDHVLTLADAKLVYWDASTAHARWSMPAKGASTVALSPQRKHVALFTDAGILVVETATGTVKAKLPSKSVRSPKLIFKPDGAQLACIDADSIQVWDLASGKTEFEVQLSTSYAPSRIGDPTVGWLSGNRMYVGGRLIDLERRSTIWNYTGPGPGTFLGDSLWFLEPAGAGYTAAHVTLPHPEAEATARTLDPQKLLLVQPGVEVAVNVELKLPADELELLRAALVEKLEANGLKVVERSSLVLDARMTTLSSSTTTVGSGFGVKRGTYTSSKSESKYALAFRDSGKTLWEVTDTADSASFTYSSTFGLSGRASLWAKSKPALRFFLESTLPKYVAQQGPVDGAYGKSKITATGIY